MAENRNRRPDVDADTGAVVPPGAVEAPPEPTTVTVKASLALAGIFARNQVRTVERTPFVERLIENGKLVVQD